MSEARRLVLALAAVAVPLALTACGSSNATDAGTTPPTGTDATVDGSGDASGDGSAPGACNPQGGEFCFELPARAVNVVVPDAGVQPADFSCPLPTDATAAMALTVSGTVNDFAMHTVLPGAAVDVFTDDNFEGGPAGTAMTDLMGHFSIMLPAGTHNVLNYRTRAPGALDTFALNQHFDASMAVVAHQDRDSISTSTANLVTAIIGSPRMQGSGTVAAAVSDCQRRTVADAVATLSTTSSAGTNRPPTFVPAAQVNYFSGGLPVSRQSLHATSPDDGVFVMLQVPPSSGRERYYIQLWGFRTAADVAMGRAGLSLLSEVPARVLPDVLVTAEMTPRPRP